MPDEEDRSMATDSSGETEDWPDPSPSESPDAASVLLSLIGLALTGLFVWTGHYFVSTVFWLSVLMFLIARPLVLRYA